MPDQESSDIEAPSDSDSTPATAVPAKRKVVQIHLDRACRVRTVALTGLRWTKPDYLSEKVRGLFEVSNYLELLETATETREELAQLGIFKCVDVVLERGRGLEDICVRLDVREKNLSAKLGVEVGDNAATGTVSLTLPNLMGRGEKLSLQCAAPNPGSDRSRDYRLTLSKPYRLGPVDGVEASLSRTAYDLPHFKASSLSNRAESSCSFTSFLGQHNLSLDCDWRQLRANEMETSAYLREHSGHSLNSAVRHSLLLDTRDRNEVISPGLLVSTSQEFSGLLPNTSKYLKGELLTEANLPLFAGIVLSLTGRAGYLHSLGDQTNPLDRFLLGGPTTLRGFNLWGLAPRDRDCALGGNSYWASGAHLFSPLPLWTEGIGRYFRLHAFANAGNLVNVKKGAAVRSALGDMRDGLRLSVGLGILWKISYIRVEVNWCRVLFSSRLDSLQPGLQFGVGMDFL